MEQYLNCNMSNEDAPYETWAYVPDSQPQETNPNNTAIDNGYNAFLLDEPLDQFLDQRSQVKDEASTDIFSADLVDIEFTQQQYQGDTDLFALPSNPPSAEFQPAPLPSQAQYQLLSATSEFSPSDALPGLQRLSPRYALPSVYKPETYPQVVPGRYLNNILNLFQDPSTALSIIDTYLFPFESRLQVALEHELRRQQNMNNFQSGYLAARNDMTRHAGQDQFMSGDFQNIIPPLPHPAPTYLPARAPLPTSMDFSTLLQPQPIPAPALYQPGYAMGTTPVAPVAPMVPETIQENKTDDKKWGNKRPLNIRKFDASKFYKPLTSPPESWGSIDPETNEPIFRYTAYGELNPLSTFTPAQISEYISQHPPNKANGDSSLRLLIQTVPADSRRRYPNKASSFCRFKGCPNRRRTIRTGDFRVCFDEQSSQNSTADPFHNAGYVHLFCLEKFLDFPQLCKDFNVQPDLRILPEGKNKMAITRDHPSMEAIVDKFIAESKPWSQFGDGIRPQDYYEHTLSYMLTKEHLKMQPKHLQKIRARRGGVTIDLHKNNLDLYVEMRRAYRKNKAKKEGRLSNKGKKRKQAESSDDESSEKESSEDESYQRTPSPRPTKKMRR